MTLKKEGFILTLAVIVTAVVGGGTILLGSAVLNNNFEKNCGMSWSAWQNRDVGDSDDLDAADRAQGCQKAQNDTIALAKPVGTLMSGANNIGVGDDNISAIIIDRWLDTADNLGNPEHKNPVRDAWLPPAVTQKLDEWKKPPKEKTPEPEEPVTEVAPPGKTPEVETGTQNPEPGKNTGELLGTRSISFTGTTTKTESQEGVKMTVKGASNGNIVFDFKADEVLSCTITMNVDIAITANFGRTGQNSNQQVSGTAHSTRCSGRTDGDGSFTFSGMMDGSSMVSLETANTSTAFSGSGFVDDDGKILGDFLFAGSDSEIDFFE